MNKEQLAYTAGIIDGEGCIKVYKVDAKICHRPHNRYTLNVQVSMTDKKLIYWLKQKFGGYFYKHSFIIKNHPSWKLQYRWMLQNQHCWKFLIDILPYLKIKKIHAYRALSFLKLKPGHIKSKHKYWKIFKKLNK
jgi:hypothetical protein